MCWNTLDLYTYQIYWIQMNISYEFHEKLEIPQIMYIN